MKLGLAPLIERVGCKVAGVDLYPDIFERLAFHAKLAPAMQALFSHKVAQDVRSSGILFVHIPKNGGTSVKRSLYSSDPGHATVRFYEMLAPELLDSHVTFALVRDPIDRFLSGFDFLMARGGADVRIHPSPLKRLRHVASLDQLIGYLEDLDGDWLHVDTFLRPQWWYLADRAGRLRIRNLFVLDTDNSDLNSFLDGFGLPPVEHLNATERKNHTMSPDQERRVRKLYERDFGLFDTGRRTGGSALDTAVSSLT